MSKLQPLNDRVIVKPTESEKMSPGGIALPDNAQEKSQRGTVVAVGPGKLLDNGERANPMLQPGDEVIYSRYMGTDVVVEGAEVKIICEDEILAKVC